MTHLLAQNKVFDEYNRNKMILMLQRENGAWLSAQTYDLFTEEEELVEIVKSYLERGLSEGEEDLQFQEEKEVKEGEHGRYIDYYFLWIGDDGHSVNSLPTPFNV